MRNRLFAYLIILVSLILVATMPATAQVQNWKTTNQITVSWDAVTTLSDGNPLPTGNTIKYGAYSVLASDTTKSSPTLMATVAVPQATLTFTAENRYVVGVKSERFDSAGNKISESPIAWSDDPTACANGQTFGVVYFVSPSTPGGLHP